MDKKRQYPNGIEGLMMMDETEQMAFWGDKYSKEYVEDFCSDYMKLSGMIKNGVYKIDDLASTNFNFSDGYRNVPNVQKQANRRVFLFGPCTVVGAYVDDSGTIECYLQQVLRERGYQNYQVINCGLFGSQYTLSRLYTEKISKEDIIIVIDEIESIFLNSRISIEDKLGNVYRGNLMEIYVEMKRPLDNIFNAWMHCNYKINKKIADRIFEDINTSLVTDNSTVKERTAIQDYYISWDVISYVREYCKKYQLICENGKCGAIVMNCNPFTKGHRYLIEQATLQIDLLYIFVVEEDKSVFKFEDRIEMVRRGTADLDNVKVLPSGKYIISKETFSQYFEKDNVEQVDDMDYDVRIFGEVVAKELGISVRFVGEEPFDKVTRKYNETMKSILPEYGIEVVEIPRVKVHGGQTISASAVRMALQEGDRELVESMLPESTIEYLRESESHKSIEEVYKIY